MKSFVSFANELKSLLTTIVASHELHAKWLNTLSYLENCGARKIAACQHPTLVKEEILKHAAEEFRHAHHLKRQILRVPSRQLPDYSLPHIVGGVTSLNYLNALDIGTCRYLSRIAGLSSNSIREAVYLLVTYAIELRAGELYTIYDEVLRQVNSRVMVKSIILEEEEHLNEMRKELEQLPSGLLYAEDICAIEGALCRKWLDGLIL